MKKYDLYQITIPVYIPSVGEDGDDAERLEAKARMDELHDSIVELIESSESAQILTTRPEGAPNNISLVPAHKIHLT